MFKEIKFVQEKLSTLKAVTKGEVEKFMIFCNLSNLAHEVSYTKAFQMKEKHLSDTLTFVVYNACYTS